MNEFTSMKQGAEYISIWIADVESKTQKLQKLNISVTEDDEKSAICQSLRNSTIRDQTYLHLHLAIDNISTRYAKTSLERGPPNVSAVQPAANSPSNGRRGPRARTILLLQHAEAMLLMRWHRTHRQRMPLAGPQKATSSHSARVSLPHYTF